VAPALDLGCGAIDSKGEGMKKKMGFLAVAALALVFLGCPEKKGPLEKAGEKIDEAVDDVGDAVEDAAEELDN
jgi:hypothetical protein